MNEQCIFRMCSRRIRVSKNWRLKNKLPTMSGWYWRSDIWKKLSKTIRTLCTVSFRKSRLINDMFDQVIITPATPTAVSPISAGALIGPVAWLVSIPIIFNLFWTLSSANCITQQCHLLEQDHACCYSGLSSTDSRSRGPWKKRRSGEETTFGHARGPHTAELLKRLTREKREER